MNDTASPRRRSTAVPAGTPLGVAVRALLDVPSNTHVSAQVNRVGDEIVNAMNRDEVEHAASAAASLVQLEAEAEHNDIRREYGVALRRILTERHLNRWAELMVDPFLTEELQAVMVRAGVDGTNVLLHHLAEADTIVSRRIYFETLCTTEEGRHLAIRLFEDGRWYVLRNLADLVGELKIEDAVPALGVVLHHEDARVRQSAIRVLATIGTHATEEHLRGALKNGDRDLRYVIARSVQGRGASALAMPIVLAAEAERDLELKKEYYRALGRIGTPDAIQALIKATAPGGKVFGKKPSSPRVVAIQVLQTTAGVAARPTLEQLATDRDKGVRAAAIAALADLPAS